jgi:predicted nucleic acid-binding protein
MRRLAHLVTAREFGGRQVHDANIIATMQAHGIPCLLTFNKDDFTRFQDLVEIIEP